MVTRRPGEEDSPQPDSPIPTTATSVRRHTRRLEDKLLVAFHHACDVSDVEIARQVLSIVELMLARRPAQPDPNRRRTLEGFVAAHERLWHLRHREN